jgi:hypothetical protein
MKTGDELDSGFRASRILEPNGRPERRDYVYRGTGRDTLTARMGRLRLREAAGELADRPWTHEHDLRRSRPMTAPERTPPEPDPEPEDLEGGKDSQGWDLAGPAQGPRPGT